MPDVIYSADVQAQMPHMHLKTKVLRSHKETIVHPILRWIKREIEVVDAVQHISILVTQMGRSYEIPLQAGRKEDGNEDHSVVPETTD